MKKIKIAFISNNAVPFQLTWIKKLSENYEVRAYFSRDINRKQTPSYWKTPLPNNCKILKGIENPFFEEKLYSFGIEDELNEFNPDIVQLNGNWAMGLFWQSYLWASKNKKFIIAGPMEFAQTLMNISKKIRNIFIWKLFYRKIDLFLSNSFIHTDYLGLGLGLNNVVTFSNDGEADELFSHPARTLKNEVTFMYGGALRKGMRINQTLNCVKQLKIEGYPIKFIIGGFGPLKEQIIELVSSDDILKEIVSFHDAKSWKEIPEIYKKSDVVINLAEWSPYGGVIYEGVKSGTGIISTKYYNSTRHFIYPNYNGFIVYNSDDAKIAMKKYFMNQTLETHSKRNKDLAKSYSFDDHLQRFNEIIETFYVKKNIGSDIW